MLTSSLMAGVGAALSPAPDSLSGLLYCCSGLKPSHLCAQWNISLVEVSSLRCPHKEILIPDNPGLGSAPHECILASETLSVLPSGPAAWLSHCSPGPLWREWTLHLGCSWCNSVSPPRQKSSPLRILLVNETHSKVMVFFGKTKEQDWACTAHLIWNHLTGKEQEFLPLTHRLFKQLQKDPWPAKLSSGTEAMNRKLESKEAGRGNGDGFWFLWDDFIS